MLAKDPEQRIQTICLIIISTIGIAFALFWLRPVMIPFVLALVFSFILTPLLDLQMRYLKIPKGLAAFTTLILGFFILFIFWLILSASINQITSNIDSYQLKIEQMAQKATDMLEFENTKIDPKKIVSPLLEKISKDAGSMFVGTINSIVKIFSKGILVIIFLMFLLIGRPARNKPIEGVWGEVEPRIKSYIITKVIISGITGVLVGIILMLFGIDLALFFGFSAFVLNFIPSVGSIIATLLPLPVILVAPEMTFAKGAFALALPGLTQFTIGNVIEPKIMGESLDLHPIVILMALIFWGMIWGIVGMLLAAPLTAIMKIIFEKIDATKPLANLLAGRLN